jgi:hypothetical protein
MPEEYGNSFVDGGEIRIDFGYGSRWDFFRNALSEEYFDSLTAQNFSPREMKLLHCELIVGAICDECFVNKQHLLKGYDTPKYQQIAQIIKVD